MGRKQLLEKANKAKNDEYYTLFEDIAAEIPLYQEQLCGKRIICPCDWDESYNEEIVFLSETEAKKNGQLFASNGSIKEIDISASSQALDKHFDKIKCNFVRFLVAHGEAYGIASISVSGYNPKTGDGVRFQDVDYSKYDLVITNPPFSLFIDFIEVMFKNQMEFIVIGPQTAITYRETFKYIKDNKMWMGNHYHLSGFLTADGTRIGKNENLPRSCCWFTNLDVAYRHDKMILTEKYSIEKYPNYYNYKGIDVSKTVEIPYDYEGKMGVPITFLQKFNPEQFEIIGKGVQVEKTVRFKGDKATLWIEKDGKPYKAPFERIIIRNKHPQKNEEE